MEQVNGYVAMTLDKFPAIRGDLVRTDPEWQSWTFVQLADALKMWTKRNPVDEETRDKHMHKHQLDDSLRKRDRPLKVLSNPTAHAILLLLRNARPRTVRMWESENCTGKKNCSHSEEALL